MAGCWWLGGSSGPGEPAGWCRSGHMLVRHARDATRGITYTVMFLAPFGVGRLVHFLQGTEPPRSQGPYLSAIREN